LFLPTDGTIRSQLRRLREVRARVERTGRSPPTGTC